MKRKGLTREIILYIVFGVLTTLVNFLFYAISSKLFHFSVVVSNIIAWFVSVLFAYITNRIWVFQSKKNSAREIWKECLSFFSGRIATGLLDTLLMFVFVDKMGMNELLMKAIINVLVIIINYIISKLLVFKGKKKDGE